MAQVTGSAGGLPGYPFVTRQTASDGTGVSQIPFMGFQTDSAFGLRCNSCLTASAGSRFS